jgi:hypothetical protein
MLAAKATARKERPLRSAGAPLKGLLFDTDGHPMTPQWVRGKGGQAYRYYISSPLLRGRPLGTDDRAIRRVPGGALDDIVHDRLQRLARPSQGGMDWNHARRVLRRIEVHAEAIHLALDRAVLAGRPLVGEVDLDRLRGRLIAGERIAPDEADAESVRVILPIRMMLRGGRTWLTTPDGRDAVARRRVDKSLVKGLRLAHALVARNGLAGEDETAKAPERPYDRQLCLMAFLAPDIQQAILEGRQPADLNLERLVRQPFPLAWADQRAVLGF